MNGPRSLSPSWPTCQPLANAFSLVVVDRPARPMLRALVAGVDEIPVEARRLAALLDQFELDVAGIGQRDRQMRDAVRRAFVAVAGQRQLVGVKPRADAAHLDP